MMDRRLFSLLFAASMFAAANLARVPLQFGAKDLSESVKLYPKNWIDCSQKGDSERFAVKNISVKPDPPVPGKQAVITAEFELFEEVTTGEAIISASMNGHTVITNFTQDLCMLLHSINMKCPLKKGPTNLDFTTNIPGPASPGIYSAKAILNDQNGNELLCANYTITVQPPLTEQVKPLHKKPN